MIDPMNWRGSWGFLGCGLGKAEYFKVVQHLNTDRDRMNTIQLLVKVKYYFEEMMNIRQKKLTVVVILSLIRSREVVCVTYSYKPRLE